MGVNGKVHKMKFKVCTKIEMHNKLLVSKLDFFQNMLAKKNNHYCNFQYNNNGEYYFLEKKKVFNECLYVSRVKDYVVQYVAAKVVVKTNCSFCILFKKILR